MDYVSGPVILYSQDKTRMLDLFSDVFEFEIDLEEDLVQSGGLNLKLIELPEEKKENFHSMGITFAFRLKNSDELKKIISKYNFFLYRRSEETYKALHKEELHSIDSKELSITDIDGRVWQFDVDEDVESIQ